MLPICWLFLAQQAKHWSWLLAKNACYCKLQLFRYFSLQLIKASQPFYVHKHDLQKKCFFFFAWVTFCIFSVIAIRKALSETPYRSFTVAMTTRDLNTNAFVIIHGKKLHDGDYFWFSLILNKSCILGSRLFRGKYLLKRQEALTSARKTVNRCWGWFSKIYRDLKVASRSIIWSARWDTKFVSITKFVWHFDLGILWNNELK